MTLGIILYLVYAFIQTITIARYCYKHSRETFFKNDSDIVPFFIWSFFLAPIILFVITVMYIVRVKNE